MYIEGDCNFGMQGNHRFLHDELCRNIEQKCIHACLVDTIIWLGLGPVPFTEALYTLHCNMRRCAHRLDEGEVGEPEFHRGAVQ